MKSAIGIGALLMDGLGDTIRVSLTGELGIVCLVWLILGLCGCPVPLHPPSPTTNPHASLTFHPPLLDPPEDPEYEMEPCKRLAKLGETACKEVGRHGVSGVSGNRRCFELWWDQPGLWGVEGSVGEGDGSASLAKHLLCGLHVTSHAQCHRFSRSA
jgi:hypothetical protein